MHCEYDAILIVSFGGPEGMADVIPFLENVLRGKNVPPERMLEVAHHYEQFGGVSPINGNCRAFIACLKTELKTQGIELPVYWGNRNWHPMLAETLEHMKADGVKNSLAFVTSAYSSYSSCRQYLEDIERARQEVGEGAPLVSKLRIFFNHPGFIEANRLNLERSLEKFGEDLRNEVEVVFTAHSIPETMAVNCQYKEQLLEASRLVAAKVGLSNWRLAFQSRSGPPHQAWLEPDILDELRELTANGRKSVVILPIGFLSDHMEVIYDLDTEAKALADELGINLVRSATVGTEPVFIKAVCELIKERIQPDTTPRLVEGILEAGPDICQPDCCSLGITRPPLASMTKRNLAVAFALLNSIGLFAQSALASPPAAPPRGEAPITVKVADESKAEVNKGILKGGVKSQAVVAAAGLRDLGKSIKEIERSSLELMGEATRQDYVEVGDPDVIGTMIIPAMPSSSGMMAIGPYLPVRKKWFDYFLDQIGSLINLFAEQFDAVVVPEGLRPQTDPLFAQIKPLYMDARTKYLSLLDIYENSKEYKNDVISDTAVMIHDDMKNAEKLRLQIFQIIKDAER